MRSRNNTRCKCRAEIGSDRDGIPRFEFHFNSSFGDSCKSFCSCKANLNTGHSDHMQYETGMLVFLRSSHDMMAEMTHAEHAQVSKQVHSLEGELKFLRNFAQTRLNGSFHLLSALYCCLLIFVNDDNLN